MMKKISILGSTGSIGVSTLKVIEDHPDRFRVVALSAGKNIGLLQKQIERFMPRIAAVRNREDANALRRSLASKKAVKILYGEEGLKAAASAAEADIVVSAISGFAGLLPSLTAIEAGKSLALANKETLVAAGEIIMRAVRKKGAKIIPVDSEHSAIFQCLEGERKQDLSSIILTASGGPFLGFTKKQMEKVTLRQALKHPRWNMGKKITIDSATMMNKGLEVIEAKWLFGVDLARIDVLVHPQSIVHSMVELKDGAILAQLAMPDMKIPIAYALSYPERITNQLPRLNLAKVGNLEFFKPDLQRFPCLRLAYEAGERGGTATAVLNAADETAVESFLQKRIRFADLPKIIEKVLDAHDTVDRPSLDDIMEADRWARQKTTEIMERIKS
ncbi:MAG TPA: 1-deoxy-D-xylulose-5-phosphate reductoisomerase [Smithella sp.]|mgnify:FL=1|nr:1-deoxy-D-xylulose-5-phosphate reductoisomerase [Smithella sp.]